MSGQIRSAGGGPRKDAKNEAFLAAIRARNWAASDPVGLADIPPEYWGSWISHLSPKMAILGYNRE